MTPFRRQRILLLLLTAVVTSLAAAPSAESVRQQMDFGVKAAKRGLWKEALFRWEKAVKLQPDNPRLLNNLAVAYETAGDFEKADATYRRALQVDPSNRDIKLNFDLFTTYFKQVLARKERAGDSAAAAAPPPSPPDEEAEPPLEDHAPPPR
jgi:Tfp pilus assembly protein PilF